MVRQDLVGHIDTREADNDFDRVLLAGGPPGQNGQRGQPRSQPRSRHNLATWFVTERVGLGFNVRYSRGTATVRLGGRSATPLELGGTHAGGGLRLAF